MSIKQRIQGMNIKQVLWYMRLCNALLGILQCLAGFSAIFNFITFDIAGSMIGAYSILFALLLILLEGHFNRTDNYLRNNFGFMFTYRGRAIYLFFIGFLDIGLDTIPGFVVGGCMIAHGFYMILIMLLHPSFGKDGELSSKTDPTIKYTEGSKEIQTQLSKNNMQGVSQVGQAVHNLSASPKSPSNRGATVVDSSITSQG